MGISQCSKRFILFGNLFLLLLLVNSSDINFQENGDLKLEKGLITDANSTKNSNDHEDGTRFDPDSVEKSQVKKEDNTQNLNKIVQKDLDKSNITESLQSKGLDQKIDYGSKNVELKDKNGKYGNKGKLEKRVISKNEPREDGNDKSEGYDSKSEPRKDESVELDDSLMVVEKEKLQDDECDPSNMCEDKKKNMTACLRVPGNDSPDLSLLIRNKGSSSVTVTITAPKFVQLEETKVHLQQKEDKKVRVSVAYEATDSLILLTTDDSQCTLDFKELMPRDSRLETRYAFKLRFLSNLTKTHIVIFLTLSAFVIFGSAWMCSSLWKKHYKGIGYQTIDTELPISSVSKTVLESKDGWDNSWDDHWDDEEAPKTPVLPATPNLSSRGLASRRLNKDGWKD